MNEAASVLVVDDDPRNRHLLEAYLVSEGHRVAMAESGSMALASLAEAVPDLILCDLMMPGMDGFDLVRRLRADERTRTVPIVMVTAVDDPGSRARLASFGATDFVTKPVDRWALQSAMQRALAGRGEGM